MASQCLYPQFAAVESDPVTVAQLLGGRRGLGGDVSDAPFALHDRLARGLPARALAHFVRRFPLLAKDPAFARVLGSAAAPHESPRSARNGWLSSQESGQLWRLAGLLTKAAPLFGDWRRRSAGCCAPLSDLTAGVPSISWRRRPASNLSPSTSFSWSTASTSETVLSAQSGSS